MMASRYDLSIPGNQRKLEAADALGKLADEAGMTLIEMALAFAIRHPAVTAAIIGPRTMEHLESQLTAADVVLSDDVLDRIDEIVPPGVTLVPGKSIAMRDAPSTPEPMTVPLSGGPLFQFGQRLHTPSPGLTSDEPGSVSPRALAAATNCSY